MTDLTQTTRYISLRWRVIVPVFAVFLIAMISAAYLIARALPTDDSAARVNVVLASGSTLSDNANALNEAQARLADEIARAVDLSDPELETTLAEMARRADLDVVVVLDDGGDLAAGILRENGEYRSVTLEEASQRAYLTAAEGVGGANTVYVGTLFPRWLETARGGTAAVTVVYDRAAGVQLAASPDAPDGIPAMIDVDSSMSDDVVRAFPVGDATYLGVFAPLADEQGVIGVFMPENAPFAAAAAGQLIALTLATAAAGAVIAAFVITALILERVGRVRTVAESLAAGNFESRTGMQPTDEIGALGYALDRYSEAVQERHDSLRASLRRQRREVEHFSAVLESIPDGVIILDLDGLVTFINAQAKQFVGESYNFFKRSDLKAITAAVTDLLGPAIAPGLHAVGAPQRLEVDGRMLRVQTVAVVAFNQQRIGTVILIRDATEDARRERAQAAMLDQLAENVPLATNVNLSDGNGAASVFAQEIQRRAVALQKLIVEMRDYTADPDSLTVKQAQRDLPLEMLIWAVANEWQQVAQAANLTLSVSIERHGLHIIGDERRLRWAIGNIVDNAVKYTPPGGKISLEIKGADADGFARLRVRDNGVGIAREELSHVFDRFYRGTPTTESGRVIRVPGSGLGLSVTRQIIEAHGGRISLRSKPGVGTAVYFTLPLANVPRVEREALPVLDDDDEAETMRFD